MKKEKNEFEEMDAFVDMLIDESAKAGKPFYVNLKNREKEKKKTDKDMKKMDCKNVSIYDNGGKTFDRISVIFNNTKRITKDGYIYDCLACSHSGSGFFQHCSAMKGEHLGKKVSFDDLNPELQKRLKTYFND